MYFYVHIKLKQEKGKGGEERRKFLSNFERGSEV